MISRFMKNKSNHQCGHDIAYVFSTKIAFHCLNIQLPPSTGGLQCVLHLGEITLQTKYSIWRDGEVMWKDVLVFQNIAFKGKDGCFTKKALAIDIINNLHVTVASFVLDLNASMNSDESTKYTILNSPTSDDYSATLSITVSSKLCSSSVVSGKATPLYRLDSSPTLTSPSLNDCSLKTSNDEHRHGTCSITTNIFNRSKLMTASHEDTNQDEDRVSTKVPNSGMMGPTTPSSQVIEAHIIDDTESGESSETGSDSDDFSASDDRKIMEKHLGKLLLTLAKTKETLEDPQQKKKIALKGKLSCDDTLGAINSFPEKVEAAGNEDTESNGSNDTISDSDDFSVTDERKTMENHMGKLLVELSTAKEKTNQVIAENSRLKHHMKSLEERCLGCQCREMFNETVAVSLNQKRYNPCEGEKKFDLLTEEIEGLKKCLQAKDQQLQKSYQDYEDIKDELVATKLKLAQISEKFIQSKTTTSKFASVLKK